jgi:L-cysteine desulfidase
LNNEKFSVNSMLATTIIYTAMHKHGDTRFARRAARESDGLIGLVPKVALADSGNLGLSSSTPSVSSAGALRAEESRGANGIRLDELTFFFIELSSVLVERLGRTVGRYAQIVVSSRLSRAFRRVTQALNAELL